MNRLLYMSLSMRILYVRHIPNFISWSRSLTEDTIMCALLLHAQKFFYSYHICTLGKPGLELHTNGANSFSHFLLDTTIVFLAGDMMRVISKPNYYYYNYYYY